MALIAIAPALLRRQDAAEYLALGQDTFDALLKKDETFPRAREISKRRVGWLVSDLAAWAAKRPEADMLPPPNTSHKNRARGPHSQPAARNAC